MRYTIFGFDPFSFYNNQFDTTYDWESLKKTGTVSETTEELDNIVTHTITYTSTDGKHTITTSNSYYKHNENAIKVEELTTRLNEAVEKQDYESAVKFRDEIKTLTNTK